MLLQSSIKIEIKRANVRFYKSKYNCKVGDIVDIIIDDLPIELAKKLMSNVVCADLKKYFLIENIQKILVDKDIILAHQSVPQKKKEKHL